MNTCPLDTLPKIVWTDDYHELIYLPDKIKKWLGIVVKCKELGCDGQYIGLVYQGKLPTKDIIKDMLRKLRIE